MMERVFALLQAERNARKLLVAGILASLVDLWGPVVILNVSGVIYTLIGIYAVSRRGVLRRAEKSPGAQAPG